MSGPARSPGEQCCVGSPGADALATVMPPPHATRTDTSSPMIVTSGPAPATSWT
jgi:hypothetical protein